MQLVPLTSEDEAILELESPTVVGHTCKVMVLGRTSPDLASLRAVIAARIASTPALTRKLVKAPGGLAWSPDAGFDVAAHVVATTTQEGEAGLPQVVARLFAERLDRARPLWRLDVVPMNAGDAALVWRVHHALADGTTLMRYAQRLLWDPQPADVPADGHHSGRSHAEDDARRRGHLAGFVRREFARTRRRSPLDGRIGAGRQVAFASVRLAELHHAAKTLCDATLNDAVLACVAGGLRRWIHLHHGHLGAVRVKVPVSLHHEGDDAANRDSFFTVALPLNEPDPVARLRATHAATSVRKADDDAETMDSLLRRLGHVSPSLEKLCVRIEQNPRSFAVNVSNVVGPPHQVAVQQSPVEAMYSIAEIGERHALRAAVVSMGDRLFFGLCADPGIVENLQTMAEGIEADCRTLVAAVGA